jgi:hypothetical protein
MWGNIRDCYVKSCKKQKEATKFVAGSSKARKYVYSDQIRFLSKLINERQTANSLSVDNMEKSGVTTVEQNRDDMNYFSQETPVRKPRTVQCGKRNVNQMNFNEELLKRRKNKPAKSTPVIFQRHNSISSKFQRRGDSWVSDWS